MWKPIGKRKAKVVLWGIVHNHATGKFDALMKLTDDYEVVGWVDDSASIEDFRTVRHTTGLNEGLAKVDTLVIKLFLRTVNDQAKAEGLHDGINRIAFKAPEDRYAGQLRELARIIRGEIPNPPGLYQHDRKVHKVSLMACNLAVD